MHKLSALQLRNHFLQGDCSAVEIAEYFLKRIEKHNKKLGAFLKVLSEKTLRKAEQLDRKRAENKPLGKLAAIPIAIKDNMHIKDEITTCASKFLKNFKAPFWSTAVKELDEADGLLIGKTNLDEFSMGSSTENSAYFPTRNPWNLNCSPGGTSGGSAAAISARLAIVATGSDTGGSIRQPAALSGIVGFKPTYGRVSRFGLVAFGSSLDQIGPMTTTVADAALMMEVMGKYCSKDSTSLQLPQEPYLDHLPQDLKEVRIGIPSHFLENLKPDAKKNFEESKAVLKDLGATFHNIDLDILQYSIPIYYILATAEASTNLARFDGIRYGKRSEEAKDLREVYDFSREDGFGPEVKQRILLGTYMLSAGLQKTFYKKAQKVRTLMIQAFNAAYNQCDIIALPVSPITAFELGSFQDPVQMYLQDIFTISANLGGLPAISIPSGFDKEHKPFGLQLIGPQLHDVSVIRCAYAFEQKTLFGKKIPPQFEEE